ncbi:MAG: glycerophosphodiester phosphodiesterase [Deltaproteobacteria bacterium]|nr:MAG: glycerophosphodiester phosphodiesterase [Deltaproteobacteria bacterium]
MKRLIRQRRPLVIGHRGYPRRETENTVPSLIRALEVGVDGVEVDVRLTGDGVPVIFHDRDLSRMAGIPAAVEEMPLSAVREVSLRGGGTVPTLEEVLDVVAGRVLINMEVKTPGGWRECVSLLERKRYGGPFLFSTFHLEDLEALTKAHPSCHRALLTREGGRGVVEAARRLGCVSLHVKKGAVTGDLVAASHAAGLFLLAYTVNEEEEYDRFVQMGVDGFFTDDPGEMVSWKRSRRR